MPLYHPPHGAGVTTRGESGPLPRCVCFELSLARGDDAEWVGLGHRRSIRSNSPGEFRSACKAAGPRGRRAGVIAAGWPVDSGKGLKSDGGEWPECGRIGEFSSRDTNVTAGSQVNSFEMRGLCSLHARRNVYLLISIITSVRRKNGKVQGGLKKA